MLLQRVIFKELAGTFLLSLTALLALILVGRMLQLRELLIGLDLGVLDLGELFFYLSPFFLLMVMPIAVMLSVFLSFLRMSTERELVALKACGVSLYQLLPAPVLFCVLTTVACYGVSFWGISWGMDNFRSTIATLVRTKAQLTLQPGVFNTDFPGLKLFAERIDKSKGVMESVFVADRSNKDVSTVIVAGSGFFAVDPDKGSIILSLMNGRIYSKDKTRLNVLAFDKYNVRMGLDSLFKGLELGDRKPKEMSLAQLSRARSLKENKDKDGGGYLRKIAVEVQKRLAQPIGCLALGLFALPWACMFRGLRQHYGIIIVLSLFFVYFSMMSMGISLAEAGAVNPAWALWTPNFIFIAASVYGIRLASREKNVRIMSWAGHLRFFKRRKRK